jgi:hypothetical protein
MKLRWLGALLLVVAFGAGAWMLLRPPEFAPLPSGAAPLPELPAAPRASADSSGKLSASAVLSIDPRAPTVRGPVRAMPASLNNEYLTAKNLKALYERLSGGAEGQTGEGQYILYEILRRCATVTDGNVRRPVQRALPSRDEFAATLAANDPQREKRLAAFDEMDTKRCAGFEGFTTTQANLNKMLADAVNAGDPKARALAIEQELWAQRRQGQRMDQITLSDAQVDSLRQILATRDPGAMVAAGRLLSNSWHDFTVRVGPEGTPIEPRAFYNAWQTLACEYGYPCGANNTRVLSECALQGHCQAQSLQDYLYYYAGSPHDSQLVMQYQQILRNAIETGDWSQVAVVRGPRPPGRNQFFFGGPGR